MSMTSAMLWTSATNLIDETTTMEMSALQLTYQSLRRVLGKLNFKRYNTGLLVRLGIRYCLLRCVSTHTSATPIECHLRPFVFIKAVASARLNK